MQNAGLAGFAELGLLFFLLGFGSIIIRVWMMKSPEIEAMSQLPLEQDES